MRRLKRKNISITEHSIDLDSEEELNFVDELQCPQCARIFSSQARKDQHLDVREDFQKKRVDLLSRAIRGAFDMLHYPDIQIAPAESDSIVDSVDAIKVKSPIGAKYLEKYREEIQSMFDSGSSKKAIS